MDVLSDILRTIHLEGSVYFSTCFCSPWGLAIEQTEKASFHIIERGQCWLQMDSLPEPKPLVGGDILILPHGSKHQISDQPSSKCLNGQAAVQRIISGDNPFIGAENNFNIVCGYFSFEQDSQQTFLRALPEIIHLTHQERQQFSWLDTVLKLIVTEASMEQLGKSVLIDRITEVLFIQVVRAYIKLIEQSDCYLSALKDKHIAKALAAIHQSPEKNWSLETLAQTAGMSRSIFANRFHHLVGDTPMKYLLAQRMQLAKRQISTSRQPLFNIAEQVGYRSDSAFKKAFKRFFNQTPASFRST
jgi:AraC-like DNA-binding protein